MADNIFIVTSETAGERLDKFLTSELKQPRSQIQKMIKQRLVTINGEAPSVHQWLKIDDTIVVGEPSPVAASQAVVPLNIIAETPDYLVVNKPTGVIVHPAAGSSAPTLTAALVKKFPAIANVGETTRPGIVHRLDKDVSGLLVVARTTAMYAHLVSEFKDHRICKIYTALVHEAVPKEEGVIDFVIARSRTHAGRMAARPKGQEGRAAETRFTVIKRWPHLTLLEIELVTGRTHQIRAHLKAFRHPIVGDLLYGIKNEKGIDLHRPFLQATSLTFMDLAGEQQTFTIPLDPDLEHFLATL